MLPKWAQHCRLRVEYVILPSAKEQMGRKGICLDKCSDKINRGKSVNLKRQ